MMKTNEEMESNWRTLHDKEEELIHGILELKDRTEIYICESLRIHVSEQVS